MVEQTAPTTRFNTGTVTISCHMLATCILNMVLTKL